MHPVTGPPTPPTAAGSGVHSPQVAGIDSGLDRSVELAPPAGGDGEQEYLILVQDAPGINQHIQDKFGQFGQVIWSSALSSDAALIRYNSPEAVSKAVSALHGTQWGCSVVKVVQCTDAMEHPDLASRSRAPGSAAGKLPEHIVKGSSAALPVMSDAVEQLPLADFKIQPMQDPMHASAPWSPEPSVPFRQHLKTDPSPRMAESLPRNMHAPIGAPGAPGGLSSAQLSRSFDLGPVPGFGHPFQPPAMRGGMGPGADNLARGQHTTSFDSHFTSSSTMYGTPPQPPVPWGQQGLGPANFGQPSGLPPMPPLPPHVSPGHMFKQKSVATTARQDYERMVALQNLAQAKAAGGFPWSPQTPPMPAAALGPMFNQFGQAGPGMPDPSMVVGNLGMGMPGVRRSSWSEEQTPPLEQLLGHELQGVPLAALSEEQRALLVRRYLGQQQQPPRAYGTHTSPTQSVPSYGSQLAPQARNLNMTPTKAQQSGMGIGFGSAPGTPVKHQQLLQGPGPMRGSPGGSPATPPAMQPGHDDVPSFSRHSRGSSGASPSSSSGGAVHAGLSAAVANLAAEQGLDQSVLMSLLQNPKLLELLGAPNQGSKQQQQQQVASPLPGPSTPGEYTRRPPPTARSSTPPGTDFPSFSQGPGSGPGSSSGSPPASGATGPQHLLGSQLLQEFTSARTLLVQLMMSAYNFLNSDIVRDFFGKLTTISGMYDEMHDLPVVQKRKKCQEMSYLRAQMLSDNNFTQVLQTICSLRHHLYSLSRKVLVMNQGPDGVPIDLLMGSMSSELYHLVKNVLPQEVSDYFGNSLPHPKLAVLVFSEFTTVDPLPCQQGGSTLSIPGLF